jgi:hypothetical protein
LRLPAHFSIKRESGLKKNRVLSTVALPSGCAEKRSLKGFSTMILVGLPVAKARPQPVYNNVPLDYLRV